MTDKIYRFKHDNLEIKLYYLPWLFHITPHIAIQFPWEGGDSVIYLGALCFELEIIIKDGKE